MEELRTQQEAERKNQEMSHNEKMKSLKLQFETSIEGGHWTVNSIVFEIVCFPMNAFNSHNKLIPLR